MLAKDEESGRMITVSEEERESGRRAIHREGLLFEEWLRGQSRGAVLDIGLLPSLSYYEAKSNYEGMANYGR